MNPLDSYEEFRKTAGFGESLGRAGQGFAKAFTPERMGDAAAASTLAAGVMGAGIAAQKIVGAINKQRDFRKMLEFSPDLVQEHDRDPKLFNQQYSSLRRLNPVFAQDPVVAGTYMRQMSMAPESAGKVLVESLGATPKARPMQPWAEAGMRAFSSHRAPAGQQPPQESVNVE